MTSASLTIPIPIPIPNCVQSPLPAHLSAEGKRRAEAGPLPLKRGEIGFIEGIANTIPRPRSPDPFTPLPARHPADREYFSSNIRLANQEAPANRSSFLSGKNPSLFSRLRAQKSRSIGGLQGKALLIFVMQLLVLAGTVAVWVFAAKLLNERATAGLYLPAKGSTVIFAHIIFAIVSVGELIFLERQLFHMRAQRYTHRHPAEVMIRHRHSPSTESAIAFAPWNRPPLPTYAAALAQSGVGTGDTEDNLIAMPPPPAYGNVRESSLLLAGGAHSSPVLRRPSLRNAERMSRSMTA